MARIARARPTGGTTEGWQRTQPMSDDLQFSSREFGRFSFLTTPLFTRYNRRIISHGVFVYGKEASTWQGQLSDPVTRAARRAIVSARLQTGAGRAVQAPPHRRENGHRRVRPVAFLIGPVTGLGFWPAPDASCFHLKTVMGRRTHDRFC